MVMNHIKIGIDKCKRFNFFKFEFYIVKGCNIFITKDMVTYLPFTIHFAISLLSKREFNITVSKNINKEYSEDENLHVSIE